MNIGLTGGIASGKSTVANLLKDFGAHVISADDIAKKVMAKGSTVFDDIVEHFGQDILNDDGEIDRAKLGAIVFTNENERHLLNNLTHPKVIEIIKEEMREFNRSSVVVVEVPLLIEADMVGLFDKIIVVAATPEQQYLRLIERGSSEADAEKRIRSQISNAKRYIYADFIVLNKGSLINLKKDVEQLFSDLKGFDE